GRSQAASAYDVLRGAAGRPCVCRGQGLRCGLGPARRQRATYEDQSQPPSRSSRFARGKKRASESLDPARPARELVDGTANLRGLGMPSREFVQPVKGVAEPGVLMSNGKVGQGEQGCDD